jgi:hypothetical protein
MVAKEHLDPKIFPELIELSQSINDVYKKAKAALPPKAAKTKVEALADANLLVCQKGKAIERAVEILEAQKKAAAKRKVTIAAKEKALAKALARVDTLLYTPLFPGHVAMGGGPPAVIEAKAKAQALAEALAKAKVWDELKSHIVARAEENIRRRTRSQERAEAAVSALLKEEIVT